MRTKRRIIKEQAAELESLKLELREKELLIKELADKVEDYSSREQAISLAMTEATVTAQKVVKEANERADAIRAESETESRAAKNEAEMLVEVAYQNARDIVKEANEQSRQRLEQTEASIRTYGELLGQYNESVMESAKQAEENAKRYATFYQKLQMAVPELIGESKDLSGLIENSEADLPEAGDDPAQLMKNIYTIEHRSIPVDEEEKVTGFNTDFEPEPEPKPEPELEPPTDDEPKEEPVKEEEQLPIEPEPDEDERVYTVDEFVEDDGKETMEIDTLIDEILTLENE